MPVRFYAVVGFVLIALGTVTEASADWCFGIFDSIVRDVKRRQCWPNPFVCPDRMAVRAPFCTMVANGWQRQNMLGECHFEQGSGKLTEAGRLKVRWILTAAPQQHRAIYVHRANTEEETSARMATVLQVACEITPSDLPPVLATSISDDGWPADQVDIIARSYQKSMPAPKLPPPAGQGGSSGGSGGTGGN